MTAVIFRKYRLLAVLILPFVCCSPASETDRTITFRVVTGPLSTSDKVYVAGNQPQLGDWNPGVFALRRQADGSWSRHLSVRRGTHLEFKFTRGTWESEAVNAEGIE